MDPSTSRAGALDRFEEAEDRWWLEGYVLSESLPEIATAGLVAGLDSPSLRVLAGSRPSDAAENRDLFVEALRELGRVPPVANPLTRTVWRVVDAVIAGRMEPCQTAHWLHGPASAPSVDPIHVQLTRRLAEFAILADECEELPLGERDEARQRVVSSVRQLRASMASLLEAESDSQRP